MLASGSRIGSYRILGALGAGGMGAVYRAQDEASGRLVALKVILGDHARDPEFMARFRLEARAAKAVRHPNITTLHEAGEHEGLPFLAFELVAGGSLDKRLHERGCLDWREAVERGIEIASALGALHAAGLVHRDLKPENILIDVDGRSRLADFGLVHRVRGKWVTMSPSLTEQGEILGTYSYMSPEQADGSKAIDGRADLYSLGAVLFALLAGRPPFEGHGFEVAVRVLSQPPPLLRDLAAGVPDRLERLIMRLLAKDPASRPASAREVEEELRAILRGQPRKRVRILAPAAVLGALAVAVVAATRLARPVPSAPKPLEQLLEQAQKAFADHDWERALVASNKALELDPALARALAIRGIARGWRNDPAGEHADGVKAVELDPGLALAWAARGATEQPSSAIQDTTRALALDPRLAIAWMNRGSARASQGDRDGAMADLTRAIELDPGFAHFWSARGFLRRQLGDPQGALADFTRAVELAPGAAELWMSRGDARADSGQYDGAVADYARAIELAPRVTMPRLGHARMLTLKSDWNGAITDLGKAIELDPRLAAAWAMRSEIRNMKGDLDGAIADATRAIELDERFATAWRVRGDARISKRAWDLGISDLERFLELAPEDPKAAEIRQEIAGVSELRKRSP